MSATRTSPLLSSLSSSPAPSQPAKTSSSAADRDGGHGNGGYHPAPDREPDAAFADEALAFDDVTAVDGVDVTWVGWPPFGEPGPAGCECLGPPAAGASDGADLGSLPIAEAA